MLTGSRMMHQTPRHAPSTAIIQPSQRCGGSRRAETIPHATATAPNTSPITACVKVWPSRKPRPMNPNSKHSRAMGLIYAANARISDPAPVMFGIQPRRNRGVHCIRFVRLFHTLSALHEIGLATSNRVITKLKYPGVRTLSKSLPVRVRRNAMRSAMHRRRSLSTKPATGFQDGLGERRNLQTI